MMKLSELQKIIDDFLSKTTIHFSIAQLTREEFESVCSAALSGHRILSNPLFNQLTEFLLDKKHCFSDSVALRKNYGLLTLRASEDKNQIVQLFKRYEPEIAKKLIKKTISEVKPLVASFSCGISKLQSFIDEIRASVSTGLDLELSLDQKIALVQIYLSHRTSLPYEICNSLVKLLSLTFIRIVEHLEDQKDFLNKFSVFLESPEHLSIVFQVIADLRAYHIDTLDHFFLCFEPDMTQAHKKAQALVAMHIAHQSLAQPEDPSVATRLNALMRYYDPSATEAFDDLLVQLRKLNNQLGSMYTKSFAEFKFNLFLESAYSTQVSFILSKIDPELPRFTLPMSESDFSGERHPFSALIANRARNPILAAQVIAPMALLRTLEPSVFMQYAERAIRESDAYTPYLPCLLKSYPVDHYGEGFAFLKKLFDLRKDEPVTTLVITLHQTSSDLLADNMDLILASRAHAGSLISALQALQKIKPITQTELDRLLTNPSNVILETMAMEALFSREDPAIQTLLKNLRTIASLRATSKRVLQPILENLAITLGLSGPFIELAIDPANQVVLKNFFLAHLEQIEPKAPALEITSAVSVSTTPLFTQSDALLAATGGSVVTPR